MPITTAHAGFRYPASYLFVPATRPDRVEKALATNAHEVIVDLEDAVGAGDKRQARDSLRSLAPSRPVHVRVNAVGTVDFAADLDALADLDWVSAVVLPKTESARDVSLLEARLSGPVQKIALVESAKGIANLEEIAASGVARLLFGIVDYTTDLRIPASAFGLVYPRSRMAVASVAAGIAPPVDGPTIAVGDAELLAEDLSAARSLGFGGKLCIHPSQVDPVNDAFRATEDEVAWARAVLAEVDRHGGGVFVLDGQMIDEPVVARARGLLGG